MTDRTPLLTLARGEFATLVKMNLLFLPVCIPLVTIGPALLALFELAGRLAREEPVSLWPDACAAFRRHCKAGLVFEAAGAVFLLLWRFSVQFYLAGLAAPPLGGALLLCVLLTGLLALSACLYFFTLCGTGAMTHRRAARNTLLLMAAQPLRALGTAVCCLCVWSLLAAFGLRLLPIIFIIACSGTAFCAAYALYPPIAHFILDRSLSAKEGE